MPRSEVDATARRTIAAHAPRHAASALIGPELLGRALGEAPDPALARIAVSRVGERVTARELLGRPEIIPAAARLLGFSTAAADFFVSHPEELESLEDVAPREAVALQEEAAGDVERHGGEAGLRRFRRRASYRVAANDLAGAAVEVVMAELSAIADACLMLALDAAGAAGVGIVALGKLGGRELNYASDVDVVFVHEDDTDAAEAPRAASAVIDLLSGATADGIALRVDANLRPEGRAGALSRSVSSSLEYYRRHAATWERQALLKIRALGDPTGPAARFARNVVDRVYPAVLPASAIEDVRSTKLRIEERVRASGKDAVELKRGRGGIRDVEFAVQLLQLVHGRRDERVRSPNTLEALRALAEAGYVALADADDLARSYRFLRRVEHRLQMAHDLQTHELPRDRGALSTLARSLGLSGADALLAEHARHAERVRALHERLFYRPLLEAFAGPAVARPTAASLPAVAPADPAAAHARAVDRTATEELLEALGYASPAAAYDAFAAVLDRSTRFGTVLAAQFEVLAPAVAFAARPDQAVVRFGRVAEALRGNDGFADALAAHPESTRRLAALVSASSAFSDALVARPAIASATLHVPGAEHALFPGEPETELVRVAAAYASRELRVPDVGRALAAVADGVLQRAVTGSDAAVPLAVIALGRFGAEELTFASDLDVVFVHEGEGATAYEAAAHAAERILASVRAAGWEVDADLRPEGRSGPLVRSLASYLEYWERWAQTWEYQALLRARPVAGDETLGRRFVMNAHDFAYPAVLTKEQVIAIRRMRVRIEEERVRPRDARRFHFKLGHGGLADVQFAVELSLMRHGDQYPEVRRRHSLEALDALASARLVEDSTARSLAEAFVFLSELKNSLEIERRVRAGALPPDPESQAALARRLGYGGGRKEFLQEYRRVTRRARAAMERVFYPEG